MQCSGGDNFFGRALSQLQHELTATRSQLNLLIQKLGGEPDSATNIG